jgi:hypothetical protein
MLVLAALGVEDEAIINDYILSDSVNPKPQTFNPQGVADAAVLDDLGAPREIAYSWKTCVLGPWCWSVFAYMQALLLVLKVYADMADKSAMVGALQQVRGGRREGGRQQVRGEGGRGREAGRRGQRCAV